jgi:hypothetical protein
MSFPLSERTALPHRLKRIQGQFEGVERASEQKSSGAQLLHLIATARRAIDRRKPHNCRTPAPCPTSIFSPSSGWRQVAVSCNWDDRQWIVSQ